MDRGEPEPTSGAPDRARTLALAVGFEGGLGLVGLVCAYFTVGLGSLYQGINLASVGWGVAATLPLCVIFGVLLRARWSVLVELMEMLGTALRSLFAASRPVDILIVSLMAGIGEELLFRGFLYAWLRDLAGPTVALVGSSLVFGLAHYASAAYALFAVAAGLYFGWLYEESGNLLTPVVAHGVYDFIAISYYLYFHKGGGGGTPGGGSLPYVLSQRGQKERPRD